MPNTKIFGVPQIGDKVQTALITHATMRQLRLGTLPSIVLDCKVLKRKNSCIMCCLSWDFLFSELVLDTNELQFLPLAIGSLKLLRILNLAQNKCVCGTALRSWSNGSFLTTFQLTMPTSDNLQAARPQYVVPEVQQTRNASICNRKLHLTNGTGHKGQPTNIPSLFYSKIAYARFWFLSGCS